MLRMAGFIKPRHAKHGRGLINPSMQRMAGFKNKSIHVCLLHVDILHVFPIDRNNH